MKGKNQCEKTRHDPAAPCKNQVLACCSHRANQDSLDSLVNNGIKIIWRNISFSDCKSVQQHLIPVILRRCIAQSVLVRFDGWQMQKRGKRISV
jgi:hypothetical protein